jgi:hypothetical protein
MTTELATVSTLLQARAAHIRKLMSGMVSNTLAIGEELEKARETFPIGPKGQRMGWATWLRNEFQMSSEWAKKLIQAQRKFGHLGAAGTELPSQKVLVFLARDTVPDAARDEVMAEVAKGKKVGAEKAKAIARKHLPSPKKANALARETGKPVEASDGYVYLGATDEQMHKAAQRRTAVYSVREAVETLSKVELKATDFLEYALPHQLWKKRNQHEIKKALRWLNELNVAWKKRGGASK